MAVVITTPNEEKACETISTHLKMQPCVLQGNLVTIDKQRGDPQPEESHYISLRILVYHQTSPIAKEIETYARYLSNLLDGQLTYYETETQANINFNDLANQENQDLVIFGEPNRSWLKQMFTDPAGCQVVKRLPTSVLVVRQPCWPLRKILLVIQGHETDNVAVDWLLRLIQPDNTAVTVLALGPEMSPVYQQAMIDMPRGLSEWLTTSSPLGQQLHRIAERLENWDIEEHLRFRQGSSEQQIQNEVDERDYDLIVIAADPTDWWRRRLLGEVINPLLRWSERSVLVAKPIISQEVLI
jgi:nucleotide-binding universal stress UspA family protein